MSSLNNSQFYLDSTNEPYIYKVLFDDRFIGELDKKDGGKLIIKTEKIFLTYNGFGVYRNLLVHTSIHFEKIQIEYSGKVYSASKNKFLQMGKSKIYPEGEKLYLNINLFNSTEQNQHQLDLFSEGV